MSDNFEYQARDDLGRSEQLRLAGRRDEARELLMELMGKLDFVGAGSHPRLRAELLFVLGQVDRDQGNLSEARQRFEESRRFDPTFKRAELAAIECEFESGQNLNPTKVDDWIEYATFGQDERIRRQVHLALRGQLRIRLTENVGDIGLRMEQLERLHRQNPKIRYPLQYLARGHYLGRSYQLAIDCMEAMNEEAQNNPSLLNIKGRSHEKLSEIEEGVRCYERSLSLAPQQPGVLFRIGRLKMRLAQIR